MTSEVRLPADPWPASQVRLPGADGRVLFVRSAAGGPGSEPALMVHGLGGSALNWTDLMALLVDRLDSRAVDMPGFGQSPPPDDLDYSLPAQVATVVRLLEADGRGPVHLFGNSLGGAVATVIASRRPDLVRTLTLISPALPTLRPNQARLQILLLALPTAGALLSQRLASLPPQERVRGVLELVYGDPSAVPPEQVRAAEEEAERRSAQPFAAQALAASAAAIVRANWLTGRSSLWRLASEVVAPTLLMYGRRDRLVSYLAAPKAKASFPHATVVVLPRTGHVAQLEHPRVVERFVRAHLDRAAARSTSSTGSTILGE